LVGMRAKERVGSEERDALGSRIRAAREAAGLSCHELADSLCISRSYVNHLELGKRDSPSADIALKMAEKLGVDPSWLLYGTGRNSAA
jgi:transcriptional regulator with XRE-family HTH domain